MVTGMPQVQRWVCSLAKGYFWERGGFFVVIFFCCAKSDMIADGNRDIETCGFSDILFADKLPQAIKLDKRQNKLRSNITCVSRE